MAAERIKRLKDLVDQLERLPASADRDRVLSEVRSRAVDLDTGVAPRAMLPMREPTPPPRPATPPRPSGFMRPAPSRPTLHVESVAPVSTVVESNDLRSLLWADEWSPFEDSSELSPLPRAQGDGVETLRPWTLGLRA
jgi:hypothetical protein